MDFKGFKLDRREVLALDSAAHLAGKVYWRNVTSQMLLTMKRCSVPLPVGVKLETVVAMRSGGVSESVTAMDALWGHGD